MENNKTNQEDVVLADYDEASPEFIFAIKFNNDQNYQSGTQMDGNRFVIDMGLVGFLTVLLSVFSGLGTMPDFTGCL